MSLSTILLVIFLTLYAITALGWVAVVAWVLGAFALATAIAMVLEGLGAVLPGIRPKS